MKYLILLFLVGCTQVNIPQEKKITLMWGQDKQSWTDHLVKEIKLTKLVKENPKSDITCKLDSDEERIEFWAQLISAIAKRESSFRPEEVYTEIHKTGKNSIGLLQLGKDAANQSAYDCKIKDENELKDPFINLSCGVKILSFWTKDPYTMGTEEFKYGCGRFWNTCRKLRDGKIKDSYKIIKSHIEGLEICK